MKNGSGTNVGKVLLSARPTSRPHLCLFLKIVNADTNAEVQIVQWRRLEICEAGYLGILNSKRIKKDNRQTSSLYSPACACRNHPPVHSRPHLPLLTLQNRCTLAFPPLHAAFCLKCNWNGLAMLCLHITKTQCIPKP